MLVTSEMVSVISEICWFLNPNSKPVLKYEVCLGHKDKFCPGRTVIKYFFTAPSDMPADHFHYPIPVSFKTTNS